MVLYDKGVLLAKLGDTVAAIETLEKSYLIQPITYTGLALANIYSMQQNPRILQICDDIIKKDTTGEVVDAVFLKGIYYSDIKAYSKALEQFEECIKRDWKFTDAHIEKGIVYFEKQDYKQALEVFKLAATVSNTYADTYYWMGKCHEALKNKEEAIQYYERAYSLDPDMNEAREAIKRLK
jgi:tetratricopeptide (TPR) repeat protein